MLEKEVRGQLALLWSFLPKADDTYHCVGRSIGASRSGALLWLTETVFPRILEKRSASLYFSTRRVTKATTVRASTSSTSHITIVGLNIVDPFRTLMPTPEFQSWHLRHRCLPLMDTGDTHVLFRFSPIQPAGSLGVPKCTVLSAPDEYID
jgi:hypothetical protein